MSSPQVGEESSQPRSGKRKLTEQVESSEDKSLDELHREVLHLQKKKLELSINKLEINFLKHNCWVFYFIFTLMRCVQKGLFHASFYSRHI